MLCGFALSMVLILAVVFPVTTAGAAESSEHLIAFDNYPPYHYWENGSPRGLNIEIINEVFSRIGLSPSYVRRPWKRSLDGIKHGDFTALCAAFKTPERDEFAFFPTRHLSLETNWVITLVNSDVEVDDVDDLGKYNIGIVSGYSYGPAFDAMKGVNKSELPNEKALLDMLLSGRVEAIVGCDLVFNHLAKKLGVEHRLKYQLELSSDPLYLVLSKKVAGNELLNTKISAALSELVADGTYQKILSRYSGVMNVATYSITTEYWPPFRIKDENGQIAGIDREIMDEVGKRLGVKFVWHQRPWVRCLAEIESGMADIVTGIAKTAEREEYTLYSSDFYSELKPAFYTHDKSLAKQIKTYRDLYGVSIGYTRGSAYFERFDSDDALNKKAGVDERQLIDMVTAERWDAFVGTDTQVEYDLKRLDLVDSIHKVQYSPQESVRLYIGVSRKSLFAQRMNDLNAIMKNLIEEGWIERTMNRYLKEE